MVRSATAAKRDKGGAATPPPLLKGGEGVRGRDGTLGIKPLTKKKKSSPYHSPLSLHSNSSTLEHSPISLLYHLTPHFPFPLHSETSEFH